MTSPPSLLRSSRRARVALWSFAALFDAAIVIRARPDLAALRTALRRPEAWMAQVGVDVAISRLAAALLWCAALWVALALLGWGLRSAPGRVGALADLLLRHVVPGAVYRLAVGALGVGIVVTPGVASAAVGASSPPASSPATVGGPARAASPTPVPTPSWPADPALPSPGWPTSPPTVIHDVPGPTVPASSVPMPRPSAGPAPKPTVTVAPGDSLWLLAGRRLGTQASAAAVAASWPAWYARNRSTIGADPNRLRPGQVLEVPVDPEGPHRPGPRS